MTLEELERDVTELRQVVAGLQSQLTAMLADGTPRRGVLSIVGSMKDFPEFDDVIAYGRYYRMTGKDPPADWKPGDPIPEPDEEWCPR